MEAPKQTASIFEILSRGQFISSNSTDETIRKLYSAIDDEENYEFFYNYFILSVSFSYFSFLFHFLFSFLLSHIGLNSQHIPSNDRYGNNDVNISTSVYAYQNSSIDRDSSIQEGNLVSHISLKYVKNIIVFMKKWITFAQTSVH